MLDQELPRAPRPPEQLPEKATKSPVADISKEDATTAFVAIVAAITSDPSFGPYMEAGAAGDYTTVRELAPKMRVAYQTANDAFKSADWPDDIQPGMDEYIRDGKKSLSQFDELAATSTDEEAKSLLSSSAAEASSAEGLAAAANSKKVVAFFGLGS